MDTVKLRQNSMCRTGLHANGPIPSLKLEQLSNSKKKSKLLSRKELIKKEFCQRHLDPRFGSWMQLPIPTPMADPCLMYFPAVFRPDFCSLQETVPSSL